ncbi:MAG: MaoC domain protein dehydratase [Frankiales bacterium]|jgi:acyl dehydratase|nr:MaoC domain protein dehydratase [Frankiales bacterium]
MPLNRDYIGRTAPAGEPVEVTRNDIRRFAAAIGDDNPLYTDREAAKAAGYTDVIAPPTFLISASTGGGGGGFILDPGLGLNFAMVVHGEESFAFSRPVQAGDLLTLQQRISDIQVKGSNELLTLVTEVTSDSGEHVATITNTIVSRGTAPQDVEA